MDRVRIQEVQEEQEKQEVQELHEQQKVQEAAPVWVLDEEDLPEVGAHPGNHLHLPGLVEEVGLEERLFKRPCKIQCTFDCHRVGKIIASLFVYV